MSTWKIYKRLCYILKLNDDQKKIIKDSQAFVQTKFGWFGFEMGRCITDEDLIDKRRIFNVIIMGFTQILSEAGL
jgi:hypothetical protein